MNCLYTLRMHLPGVQFELCDVAIQNIVCNADLRLAPDEFLDLDQFYKDMNVYSTFQRQMFPVRAARARARFAPDFRRLAPDSLPPTGCPLRPLLLLLPPRPLLPLLQLLPHLLLLQNLSLLPLLPRHPRLLLCKWIVIGAPVFPVMGHRLLFWFHRWFLVL
jgi:hypothetical protein